MPKELKLHPNERVDLDDLRYGTSTYTSDSLRQNIHRLLSGDYSGGFVLEGFRVSILDADTAKLTIVVHNGIAVDRTGRLITHESGSLFLKNDDIAQTKTLTTPGQTYYVMIEFQFADSDLDQRAFWDPSYENTKITDSGNDLVPVPKGKEFTIDVPTRLAKSFDVVVSTVGFSDSTSPNSERIPIACIPTTATAINIADSFLQAPTTTVLSTSTNKILCANTRIFTDTGNIKVLDFKDGTSRQVPGDENSFSYSENDKENNTLTVGTLANFSKIQIGDIVQVDSTEKYIKAGSKYDCRPMLFSFTDPDSSLHPSASLEFGEELRNLRYFSGRSLLVDSSASSSDYTTTSFANPNYEGTALSVTKTPPRVENNLKNSQDFFRSLCTIIREIKFGQPIDFSDNFESYIDTTAPDTKPFSAGYLTDQVSSKTTFDRSFIGSTVKITGHTDTNKANSDIKNYNATNTVTGVDGLHTLLFSTPWSDAFEGGEKYKIQKNITSDTKYVDVNEVGDLNEVYRGRIDHVYNTYHSDLQTRLAANKVPSVTVGDGITTIGDYNGDAGLLKAFQDVYTKAQGGVIYVKKGNYALSSVVNMTSHTTLIGDGHQSVINLASGAFINLSGINSTTENFEVGSTTVSDLAENIRIKDIKIIAANESSVGITGKQYCLYTGNPVKNFVLDGVYLRGGSVKASETNRPAYSYMIQFYHATSDLVAHRDIVFENCDFHVTGAGIKFESCKNVRINNCRMFSETTMNYSGSGEVYSGECSEGLIFASTTVTTDASGFGQYGYFKTHGNSKYNTAVSGEVSITNCLFSGRQSDTQRPRGWIYFDSKYIGSNTNVSNCLFLGDISGAWGTDVDEAIRSSSVTSKAYALVNKSPSTINMSGCALHSMYGVLQSAGDLNVKSCDFYNPYCGIRVRDEYDYSSDVSSTFGGKIDSTVNLFVEGTTFQGSYTLDDSTVDHELSRGITIDTVSSNRTDSNTVLKNNITIKNCSFNGISDCVYGTLLSSRIVAGTETADSNYNKIEISGCNFDYVKNAFVTGDSGFANPLVSDADKIKDRKWAVANIVYKDNTHSNFLQQSSADSNTDVTFIQTSAANVDISNNIFSNLETKYLRSTIVHLAGGAKNFRFCGNEFVDVTTDTATEKISILNVDVGYKTQQNYINDNKFMSTDPSNSEGSVRGIHNFVKFEVYSTLYSKGNSYVLTPNLEFNKNNISADNMNYVLLAKQDTEANISGHVGWKPGTNGTWLDVTFTWNRVVCRGNSITNTISNSTAGAIFNSYSNNTQYSYSGSSSTGSIDYLSGTKTDGTSLHDSAYIGMLDFRRFYTSNDGTQVDDVRCLIENNDIRIDSISNIASFVRDSSKPVHLGIGTSTSAGTATSGVTNANAVRQRLHQDVNIFIGIRCSTFPSTLNVSGNTLENCQLVVKWKYKSPFEDSVYGGRGGYDLKINNNTIKSKDLVQGCLVDVNPATGFWPARPNLQTASSSGLVDTSVETDPNKYPKQGYTDKWLSDMVGPVVKRSLAADPTKYVRLEFNNNVIADQDSDAGCDNSYYKGDGSGEKHPVLFGNAPTNGIYGWYDSKHYWKFYNVVRLWHPSIEQVLAATSMPHWAGFPLWNGVPWEVKFDTDFKMYDYSSASVKTFETDTFITLIGHMGSNYTDDYQSVTGSLGDSATIDKWQFAGLALPGLMFHWRINNNSLTNSIIYAQNNPGMANKYYGQDPTHMVSDTNIQNGHHFNISDRKLDYQSAMNHVRSDVWRIHGGNCAVFPAGTGDNPVSWKRSHRNTVMISASGNSKFTSTKYLYSDFVSSTNYEDKVQAEMNCRLFGGINRCGVNPSNLDENGTDNKPVSAPIHISDTSATLSINNENNTSIDGTGFVVTYMDGPKASLRVGDDYKNHK